MRAAAACLLLGVAGCYGRGDATPAANDAWRHRTRHAAVSVWGPPTLSAEVDGQTTLIWREVHDHVDLERAALEQGGGDIEGAVEAGGLRAEARAQLRVPRLDLQVRRWQSVTELRATLDASGRVVRVSGPSLRWGAPPGSNLRWGLLFGAHAGLGRLDDAAALRPGGGLYLGGMLSRTVGLVGHASLASGASDRGGAMAFAWGMSPQWWPTARVSLRAGPAAVLALEPGFEDPSFGPGLNGVASFAAVRSGSFVLDVRADVTVSTVGQFGTLGVGVHIN